MKFDYKKAENCFANAENYEYRIAILGAEFVLFLEELDVVLRINKGLRRPTFLGIFNSGVQVKGLLERCVIKVGFVPGHAREQKDAFDQWLEGL